MHQVRCVRNYVLVVKTVLKQTEEDGKGHTQSASTRRTNLPLGGRPTDLACFLATDGRRRTGATYAGQAKGARRKADCIGDGEMLPFPQDTHKNNKKKPKKTHEGML